jgi:hypothetical protein
MAGWMDGISRIITLITLGNLLITSAASLITLDPLPQPITTAAAWIADAEKARNLSAPDPGAALRRWG